jgi:hypothetical protein
MRRERAVYEDSLKTMVDDVKATANQVLLDFAEAERAFMRRHQGHLELSRMSLLLREIVSSMHTRILTSCRERVGDDYADIADEIAAKAIVVLRDISEKEPS